MWFKNIQYFEFAKSPGYQPDALEATLAELAFQPCAKALPMSAGWVPPIGQTNEAPLVYAANGAMLICLKIEEKVLPPAVIREQFNQKVDALEAQQGRKLYKDDKARLKEEIQQTLLTQAFSQSTRLYALIDPNTNCIMIDTTSRKRLELFISIFSRSAASFKLKSPELQSPSAMMTRWLKQHPPKNLTIAHACVVEDNNDAKGVARFKNKDLHSDSVQSLVKNGSLVTQLELIWHDRMRFTLKQDFAITSIRFLDVVQDLANDGFSESKEERFAADFAIMAETLQHFITEFIPQFVASQPTVAALS